MGDLSFAGKLLMGTAVQITLALGEAVVRRLANTAQGSNLIVLDADIIDPRIGARPKGYGVGQMVLGKAEELPSAVENYKGRDLSTHG